MLQAVYLLPACQTSERSSQTLTFFSGINLVYRFERTRTCEQSYTRRARVYLRCGHGTYNSFSTSSGNDDFAESVRVGPRFQQQQPSEL